MRGGCGCLVVVVMVAALAGGTWLGFNTLRESRVPHPTATVADSQRAQEKIYAIAARAAPRGGSIILSESELNAFLSRNLEEAGDLRDLRVDLREAPRARVAGRTRLDALLSEPPFASLRNVIPASWLARSVWIELTATPILVAREGRRRVLRFEADEFRVGRQRVPTLLVRLLLDPGALRLLRWSVPETVEDVRVEKGRVVVRIAS
jgi:hypothetical protein